MKKYNLSLRCYYPEGNYTTHRQILTLDQIERWIEGYAFTHPNCHAISVKVWLREEDNQCE